MTFDDFLDILSVFSEQAPRDIKVFYAFKIYGNNKSEINKKLLTHNTVFKIMMVINSLEHMIWNKQLLL